MSDYGDQWRERKQARRSAIIGYCLCGSSLLKGQKICYRCDQTNPYFKPRVINHDRV